MARKTEVPARETPRALGAAIDRLFALDLEAARLAAKAKDARAAYSALEAELIKKFRRAELGGAAGRHARVEVRDEAFPNVEDWDKFYAAIVKQEAWEMLQRRVSSTAWRERLERGVVFPGTRSFQKISLSLRQVKGRRK